MKVRARILIVGGVVGALIGVWAAHLFLRSTPVEVDNQGQERLPSVQPAKALTVGLGILTVLKQITGMGR